ncbi:MAG: hypothetical protein R3C58_02695 [Parvularculaceae bacterium]
MAIIDGTSGNDSLDGTAGDDTINGLAGVDILDGKGGNDFITGGADSDRLEGGSGDDTLDGGDGNDVFFGEDGFDLLIGGAGRDSFRAAFQFQIDFDTIADFTYEDEIWLQNGITLAASLIVSFNGQDTELAVDVDSSGDIDFEILLTGDRTGETFGIFDNDPSSGVKILISTPLVLNGTAGANDIFDGAGDDLLDGKGGDDTLTSKFGQDTLIGGAGNDVLSDTENFTTNFAGDLLDGGAGDDSLKAARGDDTLLGGDGADTLAAGVGANYYDGGAGDDYFDVPSSFLDTSIVRGEMDTIIGGAGDDFISVTSVSGATSISVVGTAGSVTVTFGDSGGVIRGFTASGIEGLEIAASAPTGELMEFIVAGDFSWLTSVQRGSQTITLSVTSYNLNNVGDTFFSLAGVTNLPSGYTFNVGTGGGNDLFSGSYVADRVSGGIGDDTIEGRDGGDTLTGFVGADMLFGGAGRDSLVGGDGDDSLDGGATASTGNWRRHAEWRKRVDFALIRPARLFRIWHRRWRWRRYSWRRSSASRASSDQTLQTH